MFTYLLDLLLLLLEVMDRWQSLYDRLARTAPVRRVIAQRKTTRSALREPVWPSGKALSPFLTGRMFVRRTYFGHFDEL